MQTEPTLAQLLKFVEQNGVRVDKEIHGFHLTGEDIVFPHVVSLLCLRGSARVKFDMQEFTIEKDDYGILMPGHVYRSIVCSDDFTYTRVFISAEMISELKAHAFSHDSYKFNFAPHCHLTDVQAKRMMTLLELLEAMLRTIPTTCYCGGRYCCRIWLWAWSFSTTIVESKTGNGPKVVRQRYTNSSANWW